MKKLNIMKTIQLVILVIFTLLCGYLIFFEKGLYFAIAENSVLQMICLLLWICLVLSYVFILMDFHFAATYKKNYQELSREIRSDPVSGLANRNGCDEIIGRYIGKPLPGDMACIMFELTNIRQINEKWGYFEGNKTIRNFSNILKLASLGMCFVGRNGGNKFLAIFENADQEKIDRFLYFVRQKVDGYNQTSADKMIEYGCGVAFREGPEVASITDLVSLSNRRINEQKQ